MSHYKHLTINEREKLYLFREQGKGIRQIAAELGRSPSTISREINRNKVSHRPYSPSEAQNRYQRKKKNCGRKPILLNEKSKAKIRQLIQDKHWSPEQIEHRLKFEDNELQLSYATIYRAIWAGLFDPTQRYLKVKERFSYNLRRKGKKKRKNGAVNRQGRIPFAQSISERPIEATRRSELGHWEADTMDGKRGSACLVTLTDRKSRYLLAAKVPDKTANTVCNKITELLKQLPAAKVKTVTPDRGHEFAAYANVCAEIRTVSFFFADPFSPWQRGTNENTNGLLRECLPKYTDMSPVPDLIIDHFVQSLNLRPRKCLGWLSPFEIFFSSLLHLT